MNVSERTYQRLTRSRRACWVPMSTSLCALHTINCRWHSSQTEGRAAMTGTWRPSVHMTREQNHHYSTFLKSVYLYIFVWCNVFWTWPVLLSAALEYLINLRHRRFWLKTSRMLTCLCKPILGISLRFCSLCPAKERHYLNYGPVAGRRNVMYRYKWWAFGLTWSGTKESWEKMWLWGRRT